MENMSGGKELIGAIKYHFGYVIGSFIQNCWLLEVISCLDNSNGTDI